MATRKTTDRRRRAERTLERKKRKATPRSRLVHELEAHQVELEVQNEALLNAREKSESALERYTEAFDFAPIGYATLDPDGLIREINHVGARLLLGTERGTFVGTRFATYVAARSLAELDRLLISAFKSTTTVSCELELHGSVAPFPARLTASVLRRGKPTVMMAFEDISEYRAKEAELLRTEAALREMNERKDEFFAILSHELRNPLSPIRTSVAVLRLAAPGSTAAQDAIAIIDRSAAHMSRLVDDLLDVARVTRGRIDLRREPVDLCALVRRTVDDHRGLFAKRRFEVLTHLVPGEVWTYADPARLVQVFSNVLGNAEKFTPTGGRITISLERAERTATVRICDSGVGIAPDVIGDLLQPFAQAPQPLDRHRGGLGLGLAMVRALVELHGGRAAIHSDGVGRGTEVVIELPVDRPRRDLGVATHASRPSRRRVLIVEDLHDTARSLQQALQLRGHEVDVAFDGSSALQRLADFKPDAVLCDIGLPDIDGFAFAMRVRADSRLRRPYLVALSGYTRAEDIARAKAAGFDRHLAKPAQLDEIERLLAALPSDPTANPHENNTIH